MGDVVPLLFSAARGKITSLDRARGCRNCMECGQEDLKSTGKFLPRTDAELWRQTECGTRLSIVEDGRGERTMRHFSIFIFIQYNMVEMNNRQQKRRYSTIEQNTRGLPYQTQQEMELVSLGYIQRTRIDRQYITNLTNHCTKTMLFLFQISIAK